MYQGRPRKALSLERQARRQEENRDPDGSASVKAWEGSSTTSAVRAGLRPASSGLALAASPFT